MSDEIKPETMRIDRAAKRLGLSINATYMAAKKGDIPAVKVGGSVLVLTVPFEKMLKGE